MSETKIFPKKNSIGLFSLTMITIGAVDSIRNLPTAALFGTPLIFIFLLAAILFLLPSTLVVSELVTTWPECGGIYVWVKKAFGKKIGFLAIWLQWIENLIWFPAILSFAAGSVGYVISPEIANDKLFITVTILGSFWAATFVNLFGTRHAVRLSNIFITLGLLFPILLIIVFGAEWLFTGHKSQIYFSIKNTLPDFDNPLIWVTLTGIMLSYCGIENTTAHAHEVKNPHRNFPRALLTSILILLFILIAASLSISAAIPHQKINLVSGVIQTFDVFLKNHSLGFITPIIACIIAIGCIGGVNSWIMSPLRGIHTAATDGHLPKHFHKSNKKSVPSTLLIYQACIVSIIVMTFWFIPSISGSYWVLTVLAAQLYMLMYILLFASAIRLRFKHPQQKRHFRIPFGNWGICIVAGLGIAATALTFTIGFIPPQNINVGGLWRYESILICSIFLAALPPLLRRKNNTLKALKTEEILQPKKSLIELAQEE